MQMVAPGTNSLWIQAMTMFYIVFSNYIVGGSVIVILTYCCGCGVKLMSNYVVVIGNPDFQHELKWEWDVK